MNVPVRELKARLSAYLRCVQRGEEVIITSRGRPVARLAPIPRTAGAQSTAVRERLEALPWLELGAGGPPLGATRPIPIRRGERTLSDLVLEDRR